MLRRESHSQIGNESGGSYAVRERTKLKLYWMKYAIRWGEN